MNTIASKIRDEGEYAVELVKTKNAKGQPFFAYLLLQKSNLEKFRKILASGGAFNLDDYGVVLASGEGHNPAPEVWAEVQTKLKNA